MKPSRGGSVAFAGLSAYRLTAFCAAFWGLTAATSDRTGAPRSVEAGREKPE